MSRIYSTRLAAAEGAPGANVGFTVPDGYVAVVREIDAVEGGAGGFLVSEVNSLYFSVIAGESDGDFHSHQWTGRLVADSGDLVQAVATAGLWYVTFSGYLLSAP